jgi:hypothetical protein
MPVIKLEHKWQYPVFCTKCRTVMWSRYEGQYLACGCGGAMCDQTEHYARYGGSHIAVPTKPEGWGEDVPDDEDV